MREEVRKSSLCSPERDQQLLSRARGGDEQAVTALLECYASQVDRFAADLCGHSEDARDVRQETLLAAYRGLPDFRGEASIASWLFRIARSFCIKVRRRRVGQPKPSELSDLTDELSPAEKTHLPTDLVQDKQLVEALRTALLRLPANYLQVLQMKDLDGLSVEETARLLGETVPAIKSRLVRARGELRAALQGVAGGF